MQADRHQNPPQSATLTDGLKPSKSILLRLLQDLVLRQPSCNQDISRTPFCAWLAPCRNRDPLSPHRGWTPGVNILLSPIWSTCCHFSVLDHKSLEFGSNNTALNARVSPARKKQQRSPPLARRPVATAPSSCRSSSAPSLPRNVPHGAYRPAASDSALQRSVTSFSRCPSYPRRLPTRR